MVIANALLCDVNGEKKCDIRIEEGVIKEIGENLEDKDLLDAKGAYFLPQLFDTNIRLQDGVLNAKNIKKTAYEALQNGIGHIVLNADSTPAIDNEVVLEFAQNSLHSLEGAKVEVMLNALQEDAKLSNIAILLKSGAIAPYMSTIAKNDVAIKIAEYVKMYDVTLFCKAEDNSLINSGVMLDGDVSSRLGLAGIPDLSEVLHVSRMIEIARHFKIKILFKSIASPRSIDLIDKAKKEGVAVSCEVSLHHLLCSENECDNFNTTAKLNPPLAALSDQKLLLEALQEKKIDILTTLHTPNSPVNKEVAFFDAHYGCEGLQHALGLYYTKLVKSGYLSMSELIRLTVQNPAKALAKESGEISEGMRVDALLFDPRSEQIIENQHSLYHKQSISGEVLMSFQGDKLIKF